MALGTVTQIEPTNPQFGQVTEVETDQAYPYNDPLFKDKGLALGDTITFDISYDDKVPTATNLQKYVPTERVINGPVDGPITSVPGETIRVGRGGQIKGNVIISQNSSLFVEDDGSIVDGDLTVGEGSNATFRKGGQIKGNITVSNGSLLRVVNKGVVKGNIIFNSGNKLIIGNNNGGGSVTGSITTDKIRKLSITATSTINCGV